MEFYTLTEEARMQQVVQNLLKQIENAYGRHGLSPKTYHNAVHTRNVMMDADAIAVQRQLSRHDRYILRCAAAGHDSKRGLGPVFNERASAAKLFLEMNKAGLPMADCQRASELVLATILHDEAGQVWQEITDDPLSLILADADLASLGKRPLRFWTARLTLYKEIYPERPFDRKAVAEFGLEFSLKHSFNTPEAEELFPQKQQNIRFLQGILAA